MSPDAKAKYLNSRETELFKKSQLIFGLHAARDAIRRTRHLITIGACATSGGIQALRNYARVEEMVAAGAFRGDAGRGPRRSGSRGYRTRGHNASSR